MIMGPAVHESPPPDTSLSSGPPRAPAGESFDVDSMTGSDLAARVVDAVSQLVEYFVQRRRGDLRLRLLEQALDEPEPERLEDALGLGRPARRAWSRGASCAPGRHGVGRCA